MAHIPYPPSNLVRKSINGTESMLNDFAAYRQPVTPEQRRAMVKPRAGGDYVTGLVLARIREQGIETQSMPIARMEELMNHAKELRPLHAAAQAFAQTVGDLLFRAESGVWSGTLLYYGMLKHNAQTDADLSTRMAPINDFFSRRSAAVRGEQAMIRAERKVARATKQAARAKKAADAIKARRTGNDDDFVLVPVAAEPNGAHPSNGAHPPNGVNGTP